MWWVAGTVANLVIAIAYLGIAVAILVPLVRERQLRSNPLGSATAAIFLTCAVHHGGHAVKALLPFVSAWHVLGFDAASGVYTRLAWDPEAVLWDVLSAAVAVYYWSLRRNYAPLMRGAKLFEDLRERQRQALEINDDIVQGLAEAKLALQLGERDQSEEALTATLAAARRIITDLLGESGAETRLGPGHLRRSAAAGVTDRATARLG
jgi:hypothetical protein